MNAGTRTTSLLFAAWLMTTLIQPSTADEQDSQVSAAAGANGGDLYIKYQCWQCHGYEGQGGAAPRIAPKIYPWEAFVRFVRFPNDMPAYPREALSDADLRTIYDYLETIEEPAPVEDIPALGDL